ncbi:MAG: hypothetical protein NTZ34_10885, partial [Chloroflexi bacterium]|nr:hypothetical protein [Chloroflexota bacterium]
FGVGDFAVRFFRGDTTPFMFGLPEAQIIDIPVVAIAVILLVVKVIRYKTAAPITEAVEANKNGQNQAG